jgi:hypothetical protein
LANSIVSLNYYEAIIISLLLLNAVVYPNYLSTSYFAYALILTVFSMTRVIQTIKSKFILSICMIFVSLIIGVGKTLILTDFR